MIPFRLNPDGRRWPGVFVPLLVLLTVMAVVRAHTLHSSHMDLGVFLNILHHVADGGWWRAFSGHVQPLLLLYGGLFALLPAGWAVPALLGLQSLLLALPALLLQRRFGGVAALAYGLYFPVWFNALFDFHPDHLAVILLFLFFWAEQEEKWGWALASAVALALVKEPFALQTAACGLYLGWIRGRWREGGVLLLLGGGIFWFGVQRVLPFFSLGGHGVLHSGAFAWLGNSLGEMFLNLVTQPGLVFREVFLNPGKLAYLGAVLGALLFIPLLRPAYLLVAAPILAISLLSRAESYYGLGNHYSAGLIAPLIMGFATGLERLRGVWLRRMGTPGGLTALLVGGMLLGHVVLAPSPLGRLFWTDKVWAYGVGAYVPGEREGWIRETLERTIPAGAEVVVSAQNTVNTEHLARRIGYSVFPEGVTHPARILARDHMSAARFGSYLREGERPVVAVREVWADYVVLDLKRPWFLLDRGCAWWYGACHDQELAERFLKLVRHVQATGAVVVARDDFFILRRVGDDWQANGFAEGVEFR